MATIPLPPDFNEFLKLLNNRDVRYLLIGGYAVNFHGYVRATADMDIWIERTLSNAKKVVKVLQEFGFDVEGLNSTLFLNKEKVIRMGVPPLRIEILTSISGVEFDECYESRIEKKWRSVKIKIINLEKLKQNKSASGRKKDLTDLDYLE